MFRRLKGSSLGLLAGMLVVMDVAGAATISVNTGTGHGTILKTWTVEVEASVDGKALFRGDEIRRLGNAGEPALPWGVITVLLPPDADPTSVTLSVENADFEPLAGKWDVEPLPPPTARDRDGNEMVRWPPGADIANGRNTAIYGVNAYWPADRAQLLGVGKMRKWQMARIAVPLAVYNPANAALSKLSSADINLTYGRAPLTAEQAAEAMRPDPLGLPRVKQAAINAAQDAGTYNDDTIAAADLSSTGYCIITTAAIQSASTKLAAFVAHKQTKGYTVHVITESTWGGSTGDTAANNIRTWLKNNYLSLDLKYVLFIGDPTPGTSAAPMKMCFSGGDANGEPCDWFYADLSGTWDLDGDGRCGEGEDRGTGGIDGYWEVIPARIPYYGVITQLDAILQKTINYENATDKSWRRNVLLAENPMDSSTSTFQLGEQIKDNLLAPLAIPCYRIYGENYTACPPPDLTPVSIPGVTHVWSGTPFGLVPWMSHGGNTGAAQMDTGHAPYLNDNYPSTTFQASCDNSYPEDSANLSYALLKNGCIATIGATRVSWYSPGEKNFVGSPTIGGMAYEYASRIVQGMTPGEALMDEKQDLLPGNWWSNEIVFNLWGDPSVSIMPAAPIELTVCPAERFHAVGTAGGPFVWSSKTYTLKNPYTTSISWTASETASWLQLSPTGGTLAAGGSTTVTVSLVTATATTLSEGTYTSIVTFTDTTHAQAVTRTATLDIQPKQMVGYWKLDDAAGTAAADASGYSHTGTLTGGLAFGANSVTGRFGNALSFDGTDDYITLPSLRMCRNNATFTAWIKRNGKQVADTGILWTRSNPSTAGLHFNSSGDALRYTWEGTRRGSGVSVPDGTWVFVALVVTPTSGTIYMYNTATSQWTSYTATATHGLQYFGGVAPTYIGVDPYNTTDYPRFFKGEIDDVRIYNYALDLTALQAVALNGGKAANPLPAQGDTSALTNANLWWTPAVAATGHDVYFGTNAAAVLNATTTSGEYKGRLTAPPYSPTMATGTTYYWRVDEIVGSTVTAKGDVWSFTTSTIPIETGLKFRGTMDTVHISGTTLINAAGIPAYNGRIYGGPSNPAGIIGQALALDGSDDYVRIPAMNLNTNTLTFTAWVNSTAAQTGWNGIVFCRGGNTCTGLNVGDANELRYHWDGDGGSYGHNSGLTLPNNTWVFTALVVEPDQATIYLGTGGRVSNWTNYYWHNVEDFGGYTYIGWDPCDAARRFKGSVDDVHIWNRALSPVEIQALYDTGAGGGSLANKIVTETTTVTVPEGGTAPLRVKLERQPSGNIAVAVARAEGSANITIQSGANLVFTASNWDAYQTVTLASAWDPNLTADTAIIRCSADGLAAVDVTATQQDTAAGDFDADGDVDLEDFGFLQACLAGFGVVVTDTACLNADLDGDTWIDQSDVAVFCVFFNGPNQPPKTP